jgi:hypothetical protein
VRTISPPVVSRVARLVPGAGARPRVLHPTEHVDAHHELVPTPVTGAVGADDRLDVTSRRFHCTHTISLQRQLQWPGARREDQARREEEQSNGSRCSCHDLVGSHSLSANEQGMPAIVLATGGQITQVVSAWFESQAWCSWGLYSCGVMGSGALASTEQSRRSLKIWG